MKRILGARLLVLSLFSVAAFALADTTQITAGLNAPSLNSATGGSQVIWGPIVTQGSLDSKGNTNANYPIKYAGTTIQGSGGGAGGFQGCINSGDPTQGPGTTAPFAWFCNYPVPPAPQVNFADYEYLAQQQGNNCNGQPCYNTDANPSLSPNDPVCTVNGQPKVWFFEGNPSFSSGYFCGVMVVKGSVKFTGSGSGAISVTPPSNAWTQYVVATPNGTGPDTSASNEYPGDIGYHSVAGSVALTGVSFNGYIFASTGYTAVGNTTVVGSVQFGNGAASTSGGGTIYFQPQIIYTAPPAGQVNEPIITPPGGTNLSKAVSVTIADTTPGSAIIYTTDGSDPRTSSTAITAANPVTFSVTATTTISAIGHDPSGSLKDSTQAVAVFAFGSSTPPPPGQVNAPTITPPGGSNLSGTISVTIADTTSGSAILYTSDGSDPATSGTALTAANPVTLSVTNNTTLTAIGRDPKGALTDSAKTVAVFAFGGGTPPAGQFQFNPTTYSISKDAGFQSVTVTRTIDLTSVATVHFASSDGTAQAGVDYVPTSGDLTFPANIASQTFDLPVINDGTADGSKTVILTLSQPVNATINPNANQAIVTITAQNPLPIPPPQAPRIDQLIPYSAPVDESQTLTLRVLGQAFDPAAANLIWNGANLVVLSRSATEIDALLPPSQWNNTPGSYPVLVRNPGPVDSNTAQFTVEPLNTGNPAPSLAALSPSTKVAGSPTFLLTVTGAHFRSGAVILWNALSLTTTFGNDTSLSAMVPAQDVASAGTATVQVRNPDNQMSGTLSFSITPAAAPMLASLQVSPAAATVKPGSQINFTVQGYDQNGNAVSAGPVVWSVTSQNNSVINANTGVYTAGPAPSVNGDTVTALSGSISGTALAFINNQGGFQITAITAVPNPVTGTSTVATVTASDSQNGTLTYSWSATGPSAVNFVNPNSAQSTAIFQASGTYVLTAVAYSSSFPGLGLTASVSVDVVQTISKVVVTPPTARIYSNESLTFLAEIRDQFDHPYTLPNQGVTWARSGGALSPSGLSSSFSPTADVINKTVTVTATSIDNPALPPGTGQVTIIAVGSGGSFDISTAHAYPVPWKSTGGVPYITFTKLAPQTDVKIYTTNARLVRQLDSINGEDVHWFIDNDSSERAASGVYFYRVTNSTSKQTVTGKLVLIQ